MGMHPRLAFLQHELNLIASQLKFAGDRKHMVILIGGPASGKGHFTGNLAQNAKKVLDDDETPSGAHVDESDDHLRNIQYEQSVRHFETLQAARKKGKKEFDEALADMWYTTKDGTRKNFGEHLNYENFPESHEEYYGNKAKKIKPKVPAVGDLYVSMRGWHDDAQQVHESGPLKGKPKERFKDEARERFDASARRKIEHDEADGGVLVLDSAGEDVDVQDFQGQIKHAQANGYEVTVVHLDMDPEDMTLSNMIRGAKGDRMVDQADIDNFAKTAPGAIKKLREANPDRFVHYKRTGSALSSEERGELRKKIKAMNDARLAGAGKEELDKMESEINAVLRRPQYEIQEGTTDLSRKPKREDNKEPEKSDGKEDEGGGGREERSQEPHGYEAYVERKKQQGGRPMPKKEWEERYATTSERIREVSMRLAADDKDDKKAEKSLFDPVRDGIVEGLKKQKKIGEYPAEVEGEGYAVWVTLKGAGGDMKDITAIKKAREAITKVVEAQIKKHRPELEYKITAANKGKDIVMETMLLGPEPG
jgi:hypothetical protein